MTKTYEIVKNVVWVELDQNYEWKNWSVVGTVGDAMDWIKAKEGVSMEEIERKAKKIIFEQYPNEIMLGGINFEKIAERQQKRKYEVYLYDIIEIDSQEAIDEVCIYTIELNLQ